MFIELTITWVHELWLDTKVVFGKVVYVIRVCVMFSIKAWRLSNFIVGVSNFFNRTITLNSYPICGQYPGTTPTGRLIVNCNAGPLLGRYVIIQLSSSYPLAICELEVYTPSENYYYIYSQAVYVRRWRPEHAASRHDGRHYSQSEEHKICNLP